MTDFREAPPAIESLVNTLADGLPDGAHIVVFYAGPYVADLGHPVHVFSTADPDDARPMVLKGLEHLK